MLSTLITAHSEGAESFGFQSAAGEGEEGGALAMGDEVCILPVEAAEGKAMAASSSSEGEVGGVW